MSWGDLLGITPVPFISLLLWLVVAVAVLYLARASAHKVIGTLCDALHDAFSLAAQAAASAEQKLGQRNREVLLAAGQEAKERIIEREFDRVGDSVHRDLAGYPALQRSLSDAISRIEEDHQRAVDVPPDPPGWVKAVDAVAKIPGGKDAMVGDILADIHKSLVKAHEGAMKEYRDLSRERHELLRRMMPHWRRIQQTLGSVNKRIESLLHRSRSIDRHMTEYEEISRGTDRAVSVLSSSSVVQFFISGLVLAIAVGGAAINFSLIARPMAEMVGGTNFIGGFRTADIAALVIIMVEISMGLFLMESLRITRLFPVIGALPDKMRVRMIWTTLTILFLLASVEAGLAYMREILMQDELATTAILRGGEAVITSDYAWITTAAQMGMGFTLPFALVFVALPLEAFVHSSRTVLGMLGIGTLKLLQLVLRLVAGLFTKAGDVLSRIYDIPIFMPLWIEQMWLKPRRDNERRLGASS
ncbi:MAG TPA: hypothetical protein VMR74_14405 [Gammaproteobacteria bacterium]|nr:hypothetical protein [Gammaproteobacteria bacterium]